jgi:hypothetical protein
MAKSIGGGISGVFEGAVEKVASIGVGLAKIGAGAGLAAVTYGVVGLNAELEKTTVSLASVFNAQGAATSMADGMGKASSVIKEMRKDAAQLPGEFEDLLGFFRLGAAPGLGMGASIPQLEKLSANAMAAAASTGMNMDQAAREFAQLLQGRSGAHNVFGSMLGITGDASKKFNAASGDDRLKTLEKEFGKYQASIDYFGGTFDAMQSTLVDHLKNAVRESTAPLFEKVKGTLGEVNQWFDNNQAKVEGWTDTIGMKLAYAFDVVKDKIKEWGPLILDFTGKAVERIGAIWDKVSPMLSELEKTAKVFMHHGGANSLLDGAADASKLYAGLQIGKVALPAAMQFGELGAGAMGLAGTGPAILVALAALVAVGGAIHVLTDETSAYHEKALAISKSIKDNLGSSFDMLSSAVTKVQPELITIADTLGVALLRSLEATTFLLKGFAASIEFVADSIHSAKILWAEQTMLDRSHVGLNTINEQIDPARQSLELRPSNLALSALADLEREDRSAKKANKRDVAGHGGTHIQKVEIVVSSNQDPSRIARLTATELAKLSQTPTSSRYAKNFSAARP